MSDEKMLDMATIAHNVMAGAYDEEEAPEAIIRRLQETIDEQEKRIAVAWKERDAIRRELADADVALRAAIVFIGHIAKRFS